MTKSQKTLKPSGERPSVGAIRWDAWSGGDVTRQVEKTLGPLKYQARLPWFAQVNGDRDVRIAGGNQETMDQEIAFAADAGLDYWTSRDGLHFERTFMESFLRPGLDRRSWSGRNNYAACGVLSTGPEELSLYYTQGMDQLTEPSRSHLVRYTLRTDGFVSVHAPYRGGELLTKPLIFEGNSLEINYATSASGEVRIEVLSDEGRPIEGFTLSQCDAIFGDQISRTVTWGGNADVSKISGKPIKLRFVLKDADLYSFRFYQ